MSISSFTKAAQLLYQNDFYNEALCLVCCAIDARSAKTYPNLAASARYKKFLSAHFRTICKVGFPGIDASQIRIKVNCAIDNLKPDQHGYVDMNQIIYHVIRCGLVHTSSVDESICFIDKTIIGNWKFNRFYLPSTLIQGLLAAIEESN